ncbi:MAG TPA: biotin transporter BioY [Anaeromyxobacteraceae bacterium]|nr:biotin transporter BioY [Anaeromyxobacteraceae bacterium]
MPSETLVTAVPATRDQLVRRTLAVVLGAALVALSAQVEIPLGFSPVPITLQGAAIVLVGMTLGPRLGAAALVSYLTMGVAGLPVFAGASFGILKLLGPTGGYLLAFPLGAWVAGAVATRDSQLATPVKYLLGAVAGIVVIHLGGWSWLAIATHNARAAFALGVAPFIVIDLAKAALAAGVGLGLGDRVRRLL